MNPYDLTSRVSSIFRGPQFGQYMGNDMPSMARYDFGANDPAAVYASRLPNVRGMGQPMVEPAPAAAPAMPAPVQPGMGAQGLQMPRGQAQADLGGAQGVMPPQAPSLPGMGGGQGLGAPGGLLDEPKAGGFNMQGLGEKMRAFGRGGDESGRGQGESMYAPLPSVMSAGPVGGRAGGDINVLQFMRGMARR